MLKNEVEVSNGWEEYFELLLNVRNDRGVKVSYMGLGHIRNKSSGREEIRKKLGMSLERWKVGRRQD